MEAASQRVAVVGLWHLGSVMAACLADAGHSVIGFDPDDRAVDALSAGQPPVAELGLRELLARGSATGRLRFVHDAAEAVKSAEIVCVAFDTTVDDDDRADVDYVVNQVTAICPHLPENSIVLVSSQLPVGSVRRLEEACRTTTGRALSFACSPENLRLGQAIDVFMNPDRVLIGVRDAIGRDRLAMLFAPITDRIEWMTVESAEMTKHAINGFLATSVCFINEVAALCEEVGADAGEVARGLKSERRIGPRAYLSPGSAFAGGTLARDITFLRDLGRQKALVPTPLLDGVASSNDIHRQWARRQLSAELDPLAGRHITVWGLTYKPGTNTLRRSSAIELCRWLLEKRADVHVHDPEATDLPAEFRDVTRHADPVVAARAAEALVVATEWPVYRSVDPSALATAMTGRLVLDANSFLADTLRKDARFRTISVGRRPA